MAIAVIRPQRPWASCHDPLMCRHPAILAPFNGWSDWYFFLVSMRPGISFSAISISRRPKAARDWFRRSAKFEERRFRIKLTMSETLYFDAGADVMMAAIEELLVRMESWMY